MWNSQSTGVGHFAKFSEAKISQSDPEKMVQQLFSFSNENALQKAEEAIQEAKRVYDAPNKGVVWGWEVSAYVWTKAIATGAFLVPFLGIVFGVTTVQNIIQWTGLALSLLFLTLTGVLLVKDLDKPSRFTYVLLRPQWGSWLTRGGYAIAIYGILLTLYGITKFFDWTSIEAATMWGNAIFAIITAVYTAFLFAQAKGRDFWQSPTLSLHMLVHSVMAGVATFAVLGLFLKVEETWISFLKVLFFCSIGFNLVVIFIEMLTPHPTADSKKVVQMIASGEFSALFWIGTVLIGNIAPALLFWLGSPILLGGGGVLVLIGVYITEHIWVRAPQLIPLS